MSLKVARLLVFLYHAANGHFLYHAANGHFIDISHIHQLLRLLYRITGYYAE